MPRLRDRRACVVRTPRSLSIGSLFMQTRAHLVLLNSEREGADLGPLKKKKIRHLEPEALVYVIPRRLVENIQFLEPVS